jgi:hypothetical protein
MSTSLINTVADSSVYLVDLGSERTQTDLVVTGDILGIGELPVRRDLGIELGVHEEVE